MSQTSELQSKLSVVRKAYEAGDYRRAISLASKFGQLGDERDAILSAQEAFARPAFQKALGRDPQKLIDAGIAAMRKRWGFK